MKRIIALALAALMTLCLFAGCENTNAQAVSVQAVSLITGYGALGQLERYAGVVEAAETVEIRKDDSLEIRELYVSVGDLVQPGDLLFDYDTETVELEIEKRELEYEQTSNTIQGKRAQIDQLEKEKARASADAQIDYTLQIQELELDISEAELRLDSIQKDLDRLRELTQNTEVRAESEGRVQTVNDPKSATYDPSKPLLTLVKTDTYRVKGQVNEQFAANLYEGMPMIIRSRVDETVVWYGWLDRVDRDNPIQNNGGYGYYYDYDDGQGSMTATSKYPFYVTLDSADGLMLGQHVYIEPDLGQQSQVMELPASFLCDVDSNPYVWAATASGKLEQRRVTLGVYNAETDAWEIVSGLEPTDFIAFPDTDCHVGAPVVYYDENSFGGDDEIDYGEDYYGAYVGEDDVYDGAYVDDGVYTGDFYVDPEYAEDGEGYVYEDTYAEEDTSAAAPGRAAENSIALAGAGCGQSARARGLRTWGREAGVGR